MNIRVILSYIILGLFILLTVGFTAAMSFFPEYEEEVNTAGVITLAILAATVITWWILRVMHEQKEKNGTN